MVSELQWHEFIKILNMCCDWETVQLTLEKKGQVLTRSWPGQWLSNKVTAAVVGGHRLHALLKEWWRDQFQASLQKFDELALMADMLCKLRSQLLFGAMASVSKLPRRLHLSINQLFPVDQKIPFIRSPQHYRHNFMRLHQIINTLDTLPALPLLYFQWKERENLLGLFTLRPLEVFLLDCQL